MVCLIGPKTLLDFVYIMKHWWALHGRRDMFSNGRWAYYTNGLFFKAFFHKIDEWQLAGRYCVPVDDSRRFAAATRHL